MNSYQFERRKQMEAKEKWGLIVKRYHLLYKNREGDIQKEWESYCSEFFNYKRTSNEIDSFRSIQIGSTERVIPDIILKIGNKDIIDIELKQYCLSFDNKFEKQLKSYLKLLNLSVGLIVCSKIYLCWLEYKEDKVHKIEIPFVESNEDGIELMGLLCKETFSEEKVKEFIKRKENVQEIKKSIDDNLIKTLLIDYFTNKNYADDEILQALGEINISVSALTPEPPGPGLDGPFPTSPAFIIIKTHYDRVKSCRQYFNCSEEEALYHATRHCWNVSYDKVMKYGYVLAVIDGIVKEVYKVRSWNQVSNRDVWKIDSENALGRFEFTGEVAEELIRKSFINKKIPYKYRKKGMASPTVYSDCKE